MKKYNFTYIEIDVLDGWWKGIRITWGCEDVGFGELMYGFGVDVEDSRHGFDVDTEGMDEEFINALLTEAAPKLAKLLHEHRRDHY